MRIQRLILPIGTLLIALLLGLVFLPARPSAAATFAPPLQLCSSCGDPYPAAVVRGTLFFIAADSASGNDALWKSDGTVAGTTMIKSFPTANVFPRNLTVVGGTLFFTAAQSVGGDAKLWKSDGTVAGTVVVPFNSPYAPQDLVAVGATLFFNTAWDGSYTLWKSDGRAAGTTIVKSFPYILNNAFEQSTAVGSRLFFSTIDAAHGHELWTSDGTSAGTVLVKDINPGAAGSAPDHLFAVGGTVFFSADDGAHGRELWKSDGSSAGTVLVKDLLPGAAGSQPSYLTIMGGTIFFRASDSSNSPGLWKTDGSAAGTALVKRFDGSAAYPAMRNLTAAGKLLYFTVMGSPDQLWRSDGTAAGTIALTYVSSTAEVDRSMLAAAGRLFFTKNGGLWQSDGSVAGTTLFKAFSSQSNANPAGLGVTSAGLFFNADDGVSGYHNVLWLLPISAELASGNGSSGGPGSAFTLTASGFSPGAEVTISVTPPAAQAAGLAAAGEAYVVGAVSADASGAATFAVTFGQVAGEGTYAITASDGAVSAGSQVELSASAPVLSAPPDVPGLQGMPTVFLPLLRR